MLAALLDRPTEWRHGYELTKGAQLSSGTLYPLLIRLHERGLLEARWIEPDKPGRPPRHGYRLSAAGLACARSLALEDAWPASPVGSAVPA
ncbi:PadR family transcriptional regulator [Phenylobacterium sp.]|uniref:PadR family transcriptional regulator n=1 Tax=Phenylobacterium sp. TaxID=1871053 RepID=UPI0025ED8553|nr:PadR family transcriptional regulator [Phenylobacterium sp.]